MSLEDAVNQTSAQEQANASIQEEQPTAPIETPAPVVEEDDEAPLPPVSNKTELEVLQARADSLGIKYRSNIGLEKLRAKVNAVLEGTAPQDEDDLDDEVEDEEDDEQEEASVTSTIPSPSTLAAALPKETEGAKRKRLRNEARTLKRVMITCHNPAKSEHEGEIFTFGNGVVGTIRRMVPFNVEWHVEAALLTLIRERRYTHHYMTKDRESGLPVKKTKQVAEFAITDLPALTQAELTALAQRQAMAAGTAEE